MSDRPSTIRRRSLIRLYGFSLLGILILGLFPALSAGTAGLIADGAGCTLNEGSIHACLVGGVDLGDTLYAMFVLGWLMLATIPLGAILLACWAAVLCIHLGLSVMRSRHARGGERV
jgi:hypothetical protein